MPQIQKETNANTDNSFLQDINTSNDCADEEITDIASSSLIKPTMVFPVTYTPSPYDHFVPAPRNCGGRFNSFGFLVTFGRVNNAFTSWRPRISKTSFGETAPNFSRPQFPSEYTSALNSYRRRSFQYYSLVNSSK